MLVGVKKDCDIDPSAKTVTVTERIDQSLCQVCYSAVDEEESSSVQQMFKAHNQI